MKIKGGAFEFFQKIPDDLLLQIVQLLKEEVSLN